MSNQLVDRDSYREQMEARVAQWAGEIEALQARAGETPDRGTAAELETLEYHFQRVHGTLDQMEVVKDIAWADWREELEQNAADLQAAIDRLKARLA